MAQAIITTNTTTAIDVPAGDHLFEIYGTWGGTTAVVRHEGSDIGFDGLGALTATPANASVITTGGESVEIVTTGGTAASLTVRVNRSSPRTV